MEFWENLELLPSLRPKSTTRVIRIRVSLRSPMLKSAKITCLRQRRQRDRKVLANFPNHPERLRKNEKKIET